MIDIVSYRTGVTDDVRIFIMFQDASGNNIEFRMSLADAEVIRDDLAQSIIRAKTYQEIGEI